MRGPSPSSRLLSCSFEGSAQGAGGRGGETRRNMVSLLQARNVLSTAIFPKSTKGQDGASHRIPGAILLLYRRGGLDLPTPAVHVRAPASVVNLRRRGGVGRSAASQSIKGGCNKSNLQAFAEENILGVLGGVAPALWS